MFEIAWKLLMLLVSLGFFVAFVWMWLIGGERTVEALSYAVFGLMAMPSPIQSK